MLSAIEIGSGGRRVARPRPATPPNRAIDAAKQRQITDRDETRTARCAEVAYQHLPVADRTAPQIVAVKVERVEGE
jgi:hypothetical protein